MTKEELADAFLDIDLEPLDYILQVSLDWNTCIRNHRDAAKTLDEIYATINKIVNLRLDYEEKKIY